MSEGIPCYQEYTACPSCGGYGGCDICNFGSKMYLPCDHIKTNSFTSTEHYYVTDDRFHIGPEKYYDPQTGQWSKTEYVYH